MTKEEVKKIESKITDLQAEVSKYYKDERAIEVVKKEQEILGKAYKVTDTIDNTTLYIKPISLLTREAPYRAHCLEFKTPLRIKFEKKNYLSTMRQDDFDWIFPNDDFLWIDDETINSNGVAFSVGLNNYEEISVEEYEAALANLMLEITNFSRKQFLLKDYMGENYAKEIERIIETRKIQDIQKEIEASEDATNP